MVSLLPTKFHEILFSSFRGVALTNCVTDKTKTICLPTKVRGDIMILKNPLLCLLNVYVLHPTQLFSYLSDHIFLCLFKLFPYLRGHIFSVAHHHDIWYISILMCLNYMYKSRYYYYDQMEHLFLQSTTDFYHTAQLKYNQINICDKLKNVQKIQIQYYINIQF
jgi:hypothetical protein